MCWKCVFGDATWLAIFNLALFACVGYAVCREIRIRRLHALPPGERPSAIAEVVRGKQSWEWFAFSWGILSLIAQQVVRVSTAFVGYHVFITLVDLAALAYLCFYSDWFRGRLISISIAVKNKGEGA